MAKYVRGGEYSSYWTKNTETGKTVTQWDEVTVGKSKKVWDVESVLADGMVRLHRQVPGVAMGKRSVFYRLENMDRLTVVKKAEES
jgi:hypothetical protein